MFIHMPIAHAQDGVDEGEAAKEGRRKEGREGGREGWKG